MLRFLAVLAGCAVLTVPGFARGGGHGGGGGGAHGGGGGAHGGGSAGFHGGGGYHGGTFHGSATFHGGTTYRNGYRNYYVYRRYPNTYYYPGFYGGYYGGYDPFFWDSGYSDSYSYPDSGYAYSTPPPPPPPPVIVEQAPAPALREYPGPTTGSQAPQAQKYEDPLYLLAMRDGSIHAVLAYWADGPVVRYVTMDHEQKQAPLTSIDRALSERLNRERNVAFRLPG